MGGNPGFYMGTTNPHRPIYRGAETSASKFVRLYVGWCQQHAWTGTTRSLNLYYCVDAKFQDDVYAMARTGEDQEEALPWETLRKAFLAKYHPAGSDETELDELERTLSNMSVTRMREDESVMDFRLRFTDLCRKINRLRNRVSGKEPPSPDQVLQKLTVAGKRRPVEGDWLTSNLNLEQEADDDQAAPNSPRKLTATERKEVEEFQAFRRKKAALDSEEYVAATRAHAEWKRGRRAPMTTADVLRAFMARVNSHHDRDITTLFTVERNTLSEVVAHMQKVERSMTRRKPKKVRFPTPASGATGKRPSGHLKQIMQMEEKLAQMQAESERAREENAAKYQALQAALAAKSVADACKYGDTPPVDVGHRVHPDRAPLFNVSTEPQPPPVPQGRPTCTSCGLDTHWNVWDCPTVCAKCGQGHPVSQCTSEVAKLWCEFCTRIGHVQRVCTRRHLGLPTNWQRRSRPNHTGDGETRRSPRRARGGQDDVCWNWRDSGSCSWGSRCRFTHDGSGTKRPRQSQSRRNLNMGASALNQASHMHTPQYQAQGYPGNAQQQSQFQVPTGLGQGPSAMGTPFQQGHGSQATGEVLTAPGYPPPHEQNPTMQQVMQLVHGLARNQRSIQTHLRPTRPEETAFEATKDMVEQVDTDLKST